MAKLFEDHLHKGNSKKGKNIERKTQNLGGHFGRGRTFFVGFLREMQSMLVLLPIIETVI